MQRGRPKKRKVTAKVVNPREETDFTEYYDNLNGEDVLDVKVIEGQTESKATHDVISSTALLDQLYEDTAIRDYVSTRKLHDKEILDRLKRPCFRHIKGTNDCEESLESPSRRYMKLGYHDIHSRKGGKRSTETYTRPDEGNYGLVKGGLLYNDLFRVLYDMDEQDKLFVEHINKLRDKKGLNPTSYELFETSMTFLEMQDFFIEQLLPPPAKNQNAANERQIIRASMYGSDDGKGVSPEEDQCCAVCNRNDCDSSNAIVFCDGCNIAVHQECYGIPFIPEGPWLCRRCLISRNQNQRCLFCPSTTGAFKQTDNGYWAHVICALWINELYLANPIYMEPIEGIQNVPKNRWKLTCYICKRRVGACIQCCRNSCFLAYHATCARRADLYLRLKKGIKGAIDNQSTLVTFCDKHTPREWALTHGTRLGIEKTRLFYSLSNIKRRSEETNRISVTSDIKKELTNTKSYLFRWSTHKGAPVVPILFVKRLQEFFKKEHLDIQGCLEFAILVSKYWTLKREASKAPLIRRPDPSNYSSLTDEQVEERFTVLNKIKEDVLKLTDISESAVKHSEVSKALNDEIINQAELIHFPQLYAVDSLGQLLLKCDKSNVLSNALQDKDLNSQGVPSGQEIIEKIALHQYQTTQTLINDIEKLTDYVVTHESKSSGIYRLLKSTWGKMKKRKYTETLRMEKLAADTGIEDLKERKREGLQTKKTEDKGKMVREDAPTSKDIPIAKRLRE
ncbi:hypothetical protein FOA43_001255 [Brettanomyces nanus]|uniref:Uncharacterized protein n=1 Tax=Eeniella nana TaxID=13502 RepID=A0A875RNN3_EENNA|nr:uncharacterized protein FOA43_001255 [Brettanomyces nanus]QPG73940.1 hypothetical protein FOA43_001255 [Brettanomyces nanus]